MNEDEIKVYYGINLIFDKKSICFKDEIKKEIKNNKKFNYININYLNNNDSYNFMNIKVIAENNSYYYLLDKNIIKNINEIFNYALIVPQLFIENLNINSYKKQLINIECSKDKLKSKLFNKYNRIFKKNFHVINGMDDVYEWYTGAVYFKDYEWEKINNNKLKELFETKIENMYIYSLPLDNGVILRGSDIYYYFSTDVSRFEKPTIKQVEKWFYSCKIFLDKAITAIEDYKIKNYLDLRLLLGLVDNLRNIILLLTNYELLSLNCGKNFIYNINKNNKNINKYIEMITNYQTIINEICFKRPMNKNVIHFIIDLLKDLKEASYNSLKKLSNITDSYILSKCFNPLREIDNYFENYIVSEYAIKNAINTLDKDVNEINLIGILYGGLELPFIIDNNKFISPKINIGLIFQNNGMYLDRQKKDKNIVNRNLIEYGKTIKKIPTLLIDDNVMSGVTIQLIYNQLKLCEYENIFGVIAIRHPNINRLPQIEHFKTAMNLKMIDRMFYGFVTDTPYSKIKPNTNHNNMFVNELNIFSIMTEVFLKALYKNNSFIKDSQVDIFAGYSEGKNDKV